jgi:hypothetical protein
MIGKVQVRSFKVGDWVSFPTPQGGKKVTRRYGIIRGWIDGRAVIQFVDLFHELATREDESPMTVNVPVRLLRLESGPPSWYALGVSLLDKMRHPEAYSHLF